MHNVTVPLPHLQMSNVQDRERLLMRVGVTENTFMLHRFWPTVAESKEQAHKLGAPCAVDVEYCMTPSARVAIAI